MKSQLSLLARYTLTLSVVAAANYHGALDLAELNLAHATVRAPVLGYVTHLRLRPGDYATAGETKVAIVDAHSFWVVGYFEETKLRHIRVGAVGERGGGAKIWG